MTDLKQLLLAEPPLSLAVAESLTAGRVQSRLAAISGASAFFLGGITAYSLDQKVKHLGVNRAAAAAVNSVSAEVAEQMARGVCSLFGADIGLSTTGYAEPLESAGVQQPFAWWAIAARAPNRKDFTLRHGYVECQGASRIDAQIIVSEAAISELEAFLRERRGQG